MALISKPNTFSAGGIVIASEHNENFDTLYNEINGQLSDANISASANIADTKLGSITTAGKVAFSAFTVASQAQGDVIYYSGSAWARLGAGTSGQFLKTQGAAANPVWAATSVESSGLPDGTVIKVVRAQDQTARTLTHSGNAWGVDSSKPQITEGAPYSNISASITASATSNILLIEVEVQGPASTGNGGALYIALFKDSGADAIAVAGQAHSDDSSASGYIHKATLNFSENPADTSSHTYSVRVQRGASTNNPTVNQVSDGSTFSNLLVSSVTITEIKAS
jgi:hypothetical protein